MTFRTASNAFAGIALLALAACANSHEVPDSNYNDPRYRGPQVGSMFGDSPLFSFGDKKDSKDTGGALGVNAYVWRGALDTLSFMPLASADPFGGVIITDWYQPQGSGSERFKATAYILGRALRADAIRVSIFRQVAQNGVWVDQPVSQSTNTDMENKILARARELRTQSGGN